MTGVVPIIPRFRFNDSAGNPLAGGSVTVYLAGTTTLANTYQDQGLTIANTNPVTLDASGESLFWIDSSLTYKLLLQDSSGATVPGWPVDNIPGTANMAAATQAAQDWAIKTDAAVSGANYSAKEYAQGTQASTGGSAKNWAQQTGADVTGATANSRSAKSWAQDNLSGATLGGSAKDWAQSSNLPDGSSKSAKSYATDAGNSSSAATASAATAGAYPSGAGTNVPRGLTQASVGAITGGAGGTNGTFSAAFSAGTGWVIYPTATFTVSGGALTAFTITGPGLCLSASPAVPTVSFAASTGLAGAAVALTMQFLVTAGQGYWAASVDGSVLNRYTNTAGVATLDSSIPGLPISATQYIPPGYQWGVVDANLNLAAGIKDDGTLAFSEASGTNATLSGNLTVTTINGQAPAGNSSLIARRGGIYSHQINFINNTGQSLGEGASDNLGITTLQEYDNIGFPAASTSPGAFVSLTTTNTQVSGRGESPMYGCCGMIKERILYENELDYTINDYQLCACNNAHSSFSITSLNKGTATYTAALSQVTSAYNLATAAGKSMAFQCVLWTQGEQDGAMLSDTYKALLIQLAKDYSTDGKAITGQKHDVRLICYQTATAGTKVPIAQLEASNDCRLITMACPMYQFNYGNTLHIDSTSEKWLGGYYGLAYKRTIIDGETNWKPLQPVGHNVIGSTIDLIFNKTGLVLDTTLIPAQTNSGFSVKDGGGVVQTITSVAVVQPNRVRITVSGTPAAGWSVQYGFNNATGRSDSFVGGCGNLRDSQGDYITYTAVSKPMHNWCVIFNYTI